MEQINMETDKAEKQLDSQSESETDEDGRKPAPLEFGVEDNPPWYLTIFLGMQLVLATISGALGAAFVIFSMVCAEENYLVLSQLINTSIFMSGVSTLLQVTLGVRIPVIQGSSYIYLIPIMMFLQTEQWRCPVNVNETQIGFTPNVTEIINPYENLEEPWRPRLATISGSLAVASICHILIGATGFSGFLMRFIGPLTVIPVIGLIGIMLFEAITVSARFQWGIALGTVVLMVIFSLILKDITVPMCSFSKNKPARRIPVFKLFCGFLAAVVMWILCIILTVAGAFPNDPSAPAFQARSDARLDVIGKSSWIYLPYPGQWGPIGFDTATALSTLFSVIGSVIESIGDYHATARVAQVAPPPKHAINRGILVEGLCSLMSGLFGAAHATTSYSNVMGFIGYTGNASRRTFQVTSLMFIIFGIFGKFGAALAMMPKPIIGGLNVVGLGMCFSLALTNVKHIDIESTRNQTVLGLSFVLGVSLPMCYMQFPESLQTGVSALDQCLIVICTNGPVLGGLLGFLLDNIIPGTKRERGMAGYNRKEDQISTGLNYEAYHFFIYKYLSRFRIVRFIPFLPDKKDVERETRIMPSNQDSVCQL